MRGVGAGVYPPPSVSIAGPRPGGESRAGARYPGGVFRDRFAVTGVGPGGGWVGAYPPAAGRPRSAGRWERGSPARPQRFSRCRVDPGPGSVAGNPRWGCLGCWRCLGALGWAIAARPRRSTGGFKREVRKPFKAKAKDFISARARLVWATVRLVKCLEKCISKVD